MRKLIVWTLYLLTAGLPLIFLSNTYELFEFPKFLLLLSGTIVIAFAWLTEVYRTHEYPKPRNFLDWSVLAILATQTLATIFSISPYTSFWGYYSRFHQGLLTTICYTIIYFAATRFLDKKSSHKLINISIKTAIFISLIAVLEHFNFSLSCLLMSSWDKFVGNATPLIYTTACWGAATNPLDRSFATLGQPNWLAAYLLFNLFFLYYRQLQQKKTKLADLLLSLIPFVILFTALLYTKSRSGLLGFAAGTLAFWLVALKNYGFKPLVKPIVAIGASSLIFVALIGIPPYFNPLLFYLSPAPPAPIPAATTAAGTALETGGTESSKIREIVWSGALKLIESHPIIGTGPETFAYTYYWVRPAAHNLTTESDFLYNKAHNEYLNIAAGAGLIGLLAYLSWHLAIALRSLYRNGEKPQLAYEPVLLASVVGFFITNFFGFSVVAVYYLMTVVAALSQSLSQEPGEDNYSPALSSYVFVGMTALIFIIIWPIRLYSADTSYALGKAYLDAGKLGTAIPSLADAASIRPSEGMFHSALAEAYATLAVSAAQSDNEAIKANAEKYVALALQEADTTKKLNPWHLNLIKSRAKVYLTLAAINPNFNQNAQAELMRARELAPTDAKLAYNLGLLDTRLNQISEAVSQLQDSITLKPNYQEPYYALALIYEETKQTAKLPELMKLAKANLATYSAQLAGKITKYAP